MPNLTTYDFNESPVRAFLDENGEPWFVAADVCRALDLTNSRVAISDLDEDEKITVSNTYGNPRAGIPHQLSAISESGLYTLVFKSRKAEAKEFRRWVTKEVLPSIRKTGRYEVAPALQPAEEAAVSVIIGELGEAVRAKRAGKLSNADATCLATLASQYLRAWDVKLRLRHALPQ